MKTSLKKLKRLKKLALFIEGKEKESRQQWLAAQAEHEYCLQQEAQLDEYFQHYTRAKLETMPASLFVNQQKMLSEIRDAKVQQQLETLRCQHNEANQRSLWQLQYQKKKSYEKLANRREKFIEQQEKSAEVKVSDELSIQHFLKKYQKSD